MSEKKSTKREKNTAQRIKKVRTLRKLGYYVREIMVETGLGINTVKKYISLADEPRGSRTKDISIQQKKRMAFNAKCRHFCSKKQLYITLARRYKMNIYELEQCIIETTFNNIEEIMGDLQYTIKGDKPTIITFMDNVHERRGSKNSYISLNAIFIKGMRLEENIKCLSIDDSYTLTLSVSDETGHKRHAIMYYYILRQGDY